MAEPELSYQTAFKMVQAWETADSNSKDLQKPQGSNVTINSVVRTEQPIMTRPNQVVIPVGQVTLAANAVEDNILHLNASIDTPSVMCVRTKATWLESARISNKVLYPLERSFRFNDKAELI